MGISWLKDDDATSHEDLPAPKVVIAKVLKNLRVAVDEIQALEKDLAQP